MALYAFDGTSNKRRTKASELKKNTNVVRFYDAYDNNSDTDASTNGDVSTAPTMDKSTLSSYVTKCTVDYPGASAQGQER